MTKIKVATIIGTRPEIIRLSRVINVLDRETDHTIIHTGQNYDYELNEVFFKDLGIRKPDFFLSAAGVNTAETIGNTIIEVDKVLEDIKPEAILILGDTNSCLSAIPAKKRKIPIFHMEAGNRCFDQRVPEETNRKIVDHISDVNLTYSSIAREYLLAEGFPADRVIKTGSPMFEVLHHHMDSINNSKVLEKLDLDKDNYFLVSTHREENVDNIKLFRQLALSLNAIAEQYKIPVVISTHPRTMKIINTQNIEFDDNIRLLKPLGFIDYNHLQQNAKAVLSDSGTISEESSILGFKALNIREAHERPEAMEEAAVIMTGLGKERILQALELITNSKIDIDSDNRIVADYNMSNVSSKVLKIIISYVDYVNRTVWKKYN